MTRSSANFCHACSSRSCVRMARDAQQDCQPSRLVFSSASTDHAGIHSSQSFPHPLSHAHTLKFLAYQNQRPIAPQSTIAHSHTVRLRVSSSRANAGSAPSFLTREAPTPGPLQQGLPGLHGSSLPRYRHRHRNPHGPPPSRDPPPRAP